MYTTVTVLKIYMAEQLSYLHINKKLSKSLLKNEYLIRLVYKMGKCYHEFKKSN